MWPNKLRSLHTRELLRTSVGRLEAIKNLSKRLKVSRKQNTLCSVPHRFLHPAYLSENYPPRSLVPYRSGQWSGGGRVKTPLGIQRYYTQLAKLTVKNARLRTHSVRRPFIYPSVYIHRTRKYFYEFQWTWDKAAQRSHKLREIHSILGRH